MCLDYPFGECYVDDLNDRILPFLALNDLNHQMTIEKCFGLCFEMNDYVYAGLQNGKECWCGNEKPSMPALFQSECSMVCTGDSSPHPPSAQKCGGKLRMNVFQKRGVTKKRRKRMAEGILRGSDVEDKKYPWKALIFNRLISEWADCNTVNNVFLSVFKTQAPDGVQYEMCSGSVITNKHVLTSADCLLKNRKDMEGPEKKNAEFTDASCLFVIVGFSNKMAAMMNDDNFLKVRDRHVHPHAFTDVTEYNYNIGEQIPTISKNFYLHLNCNDNMFFQPYWSSLLS